jgi:glucan phosphoethanolaminetransferase (alkaline phosphatase superfamily)
LFFFVKIIFLIIIGYFAKSNYTFVQLTAGLDTLEMDSIKKYITLALILSLALPGLVGLIAIIFIIKRRCSTQNVSSYDAIED